VLKDLAKLADGKIPTLLCFEPPPPDAAWCHRGLVAAWLQDQLGVVVLEVGHEHHGGGHMGTSKNRSGPAAANLTR
jgi:hypothetical protein